MALFFFFNDTATTEIYTLSLHDALPICDPPKARPAGVRPGLAVRRDADQDHTWIDGLHLLVAEVPRSEEHTSELQSRQYLVCRLLLEKKKIYNCSHLDVRNRLLIIVYFY